MKSTKLYVNTSGQWVTQWHGREHVVKMPDEAGDSFITTGIIDLRSQVIQVSIDGTITSIQDRITQTELETIEIPANHYLGINLAIGKPVSHEK